MRRAAIIGAGISGLATAIALRKVGFDAHVYERAANLNEAGSGMSLWPNAMKSLEELDARVLGRLASESRSLRRLLIKDPWGRLVKTLQLFGAGLRGIAVHRAELQSALADCLPASLIHLSHTFLRLDDRADTTVLHFGNGATIETDLAVGCDGIRSAVRRSLDLECELASTSYTVWRGMTALASENDAGCLGLPRQGDFSETYGHGQRFGIMRLSVERIHWYAIANNSLCPMGTPETATLLQLFSGWHAPISELIRRADSVIRTRVQDRLPFLPWTRGKVAILGDAAHPISPNFGQGACLGIEDAVTLAACFKSTPDICDALQLFERSRYLRCLEVLLTSREVGRLVQIQNRAFVHLRDQILRVAPSALTTYWFRRSCDFHPPSLAAC